MQSIQYLQQPERVLMEVNRVLKPGGVCIVTFSNRMFYTKAIGAWRDASDYAHVQLVKSYFSSVPVSWLFTSAVLWSPSSFNLAVCHYYFLTGLHISRGYQEGCG
jgi:ubiquinone/menaquinone biosynthesis C-methylase UbiE